MVGSRGNGVLAAYLAGESQARIISGILGVDMLSKAGKCPSLVACNLQASPVTTSADDMTM